MRIGCIQMNSGDDWQANVRTALAFASQAAMAGAKLIALPENVLAMMQSADDLIKLPLEQIRTTYLEGLSEIAAQHKAIILAGTVPMLRPGEERMSNRSILIDSDGDISVAYDKIHLCDITLDNGQSLQESRRYRPGDKLAIAETTAGKLGLTICYDLRFPQLFRALAKAGANIITVPSAFTKITGEAHWHVLLRARAIENGCYIVAPAQFGTHPGNRETYGHALIVDPWGRVLADAGEALGVVYADVDPAQVTAARKKIPSLEHDRPFA